MDSQFDLQDFLTQFNASTTPSIVTNAYGFILEANQAAADLFKTEIKNLQAKGMVTFGARKRACDTIRAAVALANQFGEAQSFQVNLRPRGAPMFRAKLAGKVVMRREMIVLIAWTIIDADHVHVNDAADAAE